MEEFSIDLARGACSPNSVCECDRKGHLDVPDGGEREDESVQEVDDEDSVNTCDEDE